MLNIDDRLIREVMPQIGPKALAALLAVSVHLDKKTNRCFPSHATLMRLTGMSKNGVYDALAVLKAHGIIAVEQSVNSDKGYFGRRYFRVNTDLISVFVAAKDISPLPENREPDTDRFPENRFPDNRLPENREPENRETYQLNKEEQLNNIEQLNQGGRARAKNENEPIETQKNPSPQIPAAPPSTDTIIRAEDPDALMAGLQSFYAARSADWQTVEERLQRAAMTAGQQPYTREQIREAMTRYCEFAVVQGWTFWSFSRHNARLRTWMADEPVKNPRNRNVKSKNNEGPKLDFGPAAAARAIESAERLAREIDSGGYF